MATTTPNYGWDVPTSSDYVTNGATAIETLGDDIDATLGIALNNKLHAGLVLIKTQTIGTAVTSVTVTNAFNATYDNYKILISGGASSQTCTIYLKVGNPGTGFYGNLIYANTSGGAPVSAGCNNLATWNSNGNATTSGIKMTTELQSPYLTTYTGVQSLYADTGVLAGTFTGLLNNTLSYTDFTIASSVGTLTGGTIAVYGYAKD